MKAAELCALASQWLRTRYPQALIMKEFSAGPYGSAMLDIAAIDRADGIIGIEIKGDGDSPARLKIQGPKYSAVATRMWLLPSPSLEARCFEAKPRNWGSLAVEGNQIVNRSYYYSEGRPPLLENSPHALLALVWRTEFREVYQKFGRSWGPKISKSKMQLTIGENEPLAKIREAVVDILLHRDWSYAADRIETSYREDRCPGN